MTVTGYVGPTVNKAQMEQRIVDPRLTNLIGRRDIRAVPGRPHAFQGDQRQGHPVLLAAVLHVGVTGPVAANAASVAGNASLGERVLAWDVVNPNQGITIAEYGARRTAAPGTQACPMPALLKGRGLIFSVGVLTSLADPVAAVASTRFSATEPLVGPCAMVGWNVAHLVALSAAAGGSLLGG